MDDQSSAIIIEVPGEPYGKGRPRFRFVRTKTGREFTHVYTDAKTESYERAIQKVAKVAMGSRLPLTGPVAFKVAAFFSPPVSWSGTKTAKAISGFIQYTVKPDYDNIAKIASDALNKIVFLDDKQIIEATISKHYSATPYLKIEVWPWQSERVFSGYEKAQISAIASRIRGVLSHEST